VLGKRPDGYHEVRTVMQTIDLCDEVRMSPAAEPRREVLAHREPSSGQVFSAITRQLTWASNLHLGPGYSPSSVFEAIKLVDPRAEKDVDILLMKCIPVAAGLGGGSSDAAATLRGLNRLWELGLVHGELSRLGEQIGSDVAFFLTGGTALAEGRGERITPLADAPEAWLVVVAPPLVMEEKTKRMYEALRAEDFSDGEVTEALAERIRRGERVREEDMCNAFERAAYESFEGLAGYRDRMAAADAEGVHLAGAGPALFSAFGSRQAAEAVAGRLGGVEARVFVARTLGAAEATRLEVE
jgi:4-diphosphocytidyl-2-C-methyl-D-erythritol kinase